MKQLEINCRHCGRFIQTVENSGVFNVKCGDSKCRKLRAGLDRYKVVFMSDYAKEHTTHDHTTPQV